MVSAGQRAARRLGSAHAVGDEGRRVDLTGLSLGQILRETHRKTLTCPGRRWLEPLRGPDEEICGVLVRQQQAIERQCRLDRGQTGKIDIVDKGRAT